MRLQEAPRVLDALADYTRRGGKLDVAVGNRDFLLDESFCERTGAELRPSGMVGVASGKRLLLIHGDELCTKDKGYQRLRFVLRSRPVRALGLRLPLPLALRLARRLRRASTKALEIKPSEEKMMQVEAAIDWTERHRCERIICGHAHPKRSIEYRDPFPFKSVTHIGTSCAPSSVSTSTVPSKWSSTSLSITSPSGASLASRTN